MRHFLVIVSTFMLAWPAWAGKSNEPLRVAIPYSLAPPLLITDDKGQAQGIVRDYINAIEKRIGRKFELVVIPKFRIHEMINKGMAEINCYTSPTWVPNPEKYTWSKVLFMKREVLASRKAVSSYSEIKGERVGTVLRYIYPHIDPLFKSGRLIREDVPTEEQNLQKFVNKRINNVVADDTHLDYFLKKNDKSKNPVHKLVMQEYPIHCLIAAKDAQTTDSFNKAIEEIKSSDELDRIFAQYK
ncbi:transporter substrate-binding domain-containing protein [Bdellovibrio bacteriovorus]|uniref:ABC-transporter, periplasmic domain n=1 Tax=Bdellovibrio bacteriovorus (strain ATCC 15356 / DSM 50701 / NCIMB 9529 / HD100) TaxID=264462 RepID=Q6MPR8_BDEBA|nr:transporter substrate-binding domain-containing protein [Bdellovibrio bacteriovorus]CAE78729.1 ABC-transporter, periplasmic domain [Bdellovibrio bacteriovorus HD100]